jgi:hypothetical protein
MQKLLKIGAAAAALTLAAGFATAAMADPTTVDIVNSHDAAVTEIHMTDIDNHDWDADLLGDDVLASGDTTSVTPDEPNGYCRFDLEVKFENGTTWDLRDFNACTASQIEIGGRSFAITDLKGQVSYRRPS